MTPGRVRHLAHRTINEARVAWRYRIPHEASSDLEDGRRVHADMPDFDHAALRVEGARALLALGETDRDIHEREWLRDRWAAVEAEQEWRVDTA